MKTHYGLIMSIVSCFLLLSACSEGINKLTERSINDTTAGSTGGVNKQTQGATTDAAAGSSNVPGRDAEIEQITQSLNGHKLLYSWRQGGVLYGTYFFQEVHFCNLDHYLLFGRSEKNTVLDNIQRGSWQEEGRWSVTRSSQGQIGVRYQSTSGSDFFVPFSSEGLSITQQGTAACR